MKKKKDITFDTSTELFSLVGESRKSALEAGIEEEPGGFPGMKTLLMSKMGMGKAEESIFDMELRPLEEVEKVERQVALDAIEADDGFMDMLKDL